MNAKDRSTGKVMSSCRQLWRLLGGEAHEGEACSLLTTRIRWLCKQALSTVSNNLMRTGGAAEQAKALARTQIL
jgi:hypothetical protein